MQRDMNRDEIAEICEATPLFIADMILEQKKTIAQLEAELALYKNETEMMIHGAEVVARRECRDIRDERGQLQDNLAFLGKEWSATKIQLAEANRTIAILRAKQEQHESTVLATVAKRDEYKRKLDVALEALKAIGNREESKPVCLLCAATAREALKEIEK